MFIHFFAISFVEVTKNVKLFLIKNSNMAEKEHWWSKRRIYYCEPCRRLCHWGLKEDPVTEDPKENPFNEKSKEDIITVTTVDNFINEDPQELQDPQWLLRLKLFLFSFLLMVYDRVGDGDKISKKNFGRGRSRFHATSHLKIDAEVYFS